jgi:hypothetical protein
MAKAKTTLTPAELGNMLLGVLETLPAGAEVSFRHISASPAMYAVTLKVPHNRVHAYTGQDPSELLLESGKRLAKLITDAQIAKLPEDFLPEDG